jgi:G3E family GTPase
MTSNEPIPVTLLTGFLGSGKTTLLNRLLKSLPRTAVIMNEFGEIGLDHELLEKKRGPLALLQGGCVCCQVQGSLAPTFRNLFMARETVSVPPFERVIIETTGIADPIPIVNTLINDRWLAARFRLKALLTTVDAALAERQLDSHLEAVRQVACADRLILTKADLVEDRQVDTLRRRLADINPAAELLVASHGDLPVDRVLAPAAERSTRFVATGFRPALHRKPREPGHDHRFRSLGLSIDAALGWPGLYAALKALIGETGGRVLRLKGLVQLEGEAVPTVIQGVQHILFPPEKLPEWPNGRRGASFVFIFQDADADMAENAIARFRDVLLAAA